MIEIITQKVEMPDIDECRYQYNQKNNKWFVTDTHNDNSIRYKGGFEMACIACHNLNKKYYLEINK